MKDNKIYSWKLNSIEGITEDRNFALITFKNGLCAVVNFELNGFMVEVLLETFYKWMHFPNEATEKEKETIKNILSNPTGYEISSSARNYLEYPDSKDEWDKIKKDFGYTY
ncbi:MAG: hypothetical protein Q3988_05655 [Gemella sp.]|nr:hypothetical protein [Gemella sp.]